MIPSVGKVEEDGKRTYSDQIILSSLEVEHVPPHRRVVGLDLCVLWVGRVGQDVFGNLQ